MLLLIDGDHIPYSACNGKRDYIQCIEYSDFLIGSILRWGDSYRLFLSEGKSFRHQVAGDYKANRSLIKPLYWKETRDYLYDYWKAESVAGLEADDLCGIYNGDDTIICSPDKDMRTVPGNHLILRRGGEHVLTYVTEEEAWRNFFVQLIAGDQSDNITGLKNPQKAHHKKPPNFSLDVATKTLANKSKAEMEELVQNLYKQQYKDQWKLQYQKNYKLLWILRDFPSQDVTLEI